MSRSIFQRSRRTVACEKCAEPAAHKEHGFDLCFSCSSLAVAMNANDFAEWFRLSPESGTSLSIARLHAETARFERVFAGRK